MSLSVVCKERGLSFFFFQAEDGIRYLVRSRGLGDVYKRQDTGLRRDLQEVLTQRDLRCLVDDRPEPDQPGPALLSLIHI